MGDDTTALVLALAIKNVELPTASAEVQELLIKTAVGATEMHFSLKCSFKTTFYLIRNFHYFLIRRF
ncbi:hypothetical protein MKK70_22905 [Methylobacterium sp. E-041]|uniref:hypothetical protein n=1 Tax=Methylobacterium sp. E-041 TaxID=2836573 RepID=UPI001FB96327|nr:hypothetical protein [Methylobacterium sp. E-041]MCJ2108170.1 hypothetical protein [Methylobacterium sp. E-041]